VVLKTAEGNQPHDTIPTSISNATRTVPPQNVGDIYATPCNSSPSGFTVKWEALICAATIHGVVPRELVTLMPLMPLMLHVRIHLHLISSLICKLI
jgi:hypothetical protein